MERERAKHNLAVFHLGSAGQQLPEVKGYVVSLHLHPWTCHSPQRTQQVSWRPPNTHKPVHGKVWGVSECREKGCMQTHKNKSSKTLTTKYKLEQFYSYIGGTSHCWRQKIKAFNRERHQGKKDVSNLNAGKTVWFVREVVQLERDFFCCLQGYLKILELILHSHP